MESKKKGLGHSRPYYPNDVDECHLESGLPPMNAFSRWRRERRQQGHPQPPQEGYAAFFERWWQKADLTEEGNRAWWLGHATVLLHIHGLWIITDPVFSKRVSPFRFSGPQRCVPPAVSLEDLPQLDAVLISHNHYDHLDKPSVKVIAKRFPQARFYTPAGLGKWFRHQGIHQVYELNWWESSPLSQANIVCVPARHWSMRALWDRQRTLWGGWVVQSKGTNFYFAGDTGYSSQLAEIGVRLGPFDLAALPIGAYSPRWFMQNQHIDPHEAVRLHRELRCRYSLAIHWATFELADEALDEPPLVLQQALQEQGVSSDSFRLLKIGQSWSL